MEVTKPVRSPTKKPSYAGRFRESVSGRFRKINPAPYVLLTNAKSESTTRDNYSREGKIEPKQTDMTTRSSANRAKNTNEGPEEERPHDCTAPDKESESNLHGEAKNSLLDDELARRDENLCAPSPLSPPAPMFLSESEYEEIMNGIDSDDDESKSDDYDLYALDLYSCQSDHAATRRRLENRAPVLSSQRPHSLTW